MTNARWFYSEDHKQLCLCVEKQNIWDETTCRVWLPNQDIVVQLPASRLKSLEEAGISTADSIAYVTAAARVSEALTQDVLLAPIESAVIPLPHQIRAISRAIAKDRVRYLLADEVGLGKTIEAGLIMRELKLRGLVQRTLVIAPRGLVTQWVAEMRTHFNELFHLVQSDDLKTLSRIVAVGGFTSKVLRSEYELSTRNRESANPWQMFSQVVVPMDSVKPLDKRRGWTIAQVEEYNRERFEDLISAGWDLVIVDEAHRLGGSTDQVARFKLGQGLSEAAPYFLLLTATPHQGKTDAFHRLVSLIDAQAFPDIGSVTRDRLQPYVIRTEKRHAIDAEGKPLFKPRRTQLAPVSWGERHCDQKLLYETVTEYVREGYNQAIREKRNYIGFLMILMQRLVVSSTSAIKTTLQRRLEVLKSESGLPTLFDSLETQNAEFETFYDLDGQEQMEMLLRTHLKALKNERAEVKLLLEAASCCEQAAADAKAEALLDWIYRLQAEEGDPDLKVLVFTEFVPTQEMLRQFLTERGFQVVCLNGSMDTEERQRVQEAFAQEARILISTDAGGEGLNLQFCHVVINYDIPWNPMRLEQRIGRVDRIGQTHIVRAVNFVFQDSVEHRVREVLEEKLEIIFKEFGIDKTSDVLDSAQASQMFDDLYVKAILHPDKIDDSVNNIVTRIQEQAREAQETSSILGASEDLDPGEAERLLSHPLPHWVERMTVSFLSAHDGKAEKNDRCWNLTWPDGESYPGVVFTGKDAADIPAARHLTLEDTRVRNLAMRIPGFVPGQPVPSVLIPGVAHEIKGFWSLWQISVIASDRNRSRTMPLFLADNGKVLMPTARHIWDQLLMASPVVSTMLDVEISQKAFEQSRHAAEEHGQLIYAALVQEHQANIDREREKAEYAYAARGRAIERIGLPQIRSYRLNILAEEERKFREQLERKAQVYPEMVPLIMIWVKSSDHE